MDRRDKTQSRFSETWRSFCRQAVLTLIFCWNRHWPARACLPRAEISIILFSLAWEWKALISTQPIKMSSGPDWRGGVWPCLKRTVVSMCLDNIDTKEVCRWIALFLCVLLSLFLPYVPYMTNCTCLTDNCKSARQKKKKKKVHPYSASIFCTPQSRRRAGAYTQHSLDVGLHTAWIDCQSITKITPSNRQPLSHHGQFSISP